MKSLSLSRIADRIHLPLCRRYLLVNFIAQPLSDGASTSGQASSTSWALGTHSDGQQEVLGVWRHATLGAIDWTEVFGEFLDRGVERIRFVLNANSSAVQVAFPQSLVLDSAILGWDPGVAGPQRSQGTDNPAATVFQEDKLPRRVQELACRSRDTAAVLKRVLELESKRHGPFTTKADETAFIANWLVTVASRHCSGPHAALRRRPRTALGNAVV